MEAKVLHKKKALAPKLRFSGVEGSWKNILYGDIYTFYTTNSFSRDNLNYNTGEVKNIHYGDIHTKFATLFDIKKEEVPFINPDIDIKNIKNESYCQEGDLVIADASEDYADIGKTIELINLNNENIIAGLHTFLARPNKYEMAKGFAGYLVQSWNFRKQVMVIAQGTKVLSLSTGRLANVKINIPSLPEQQKIASFLTAVDEKIQQLTRKKELLEQYKKGVMQQLFSGKLRFKDENGKAFPKWEEKRVDQLFNVTRGNVLAVPRMSKKSTDKTPYPVYSSQTKENGLTGYYDEFLFEDSITWTTDGANAGEVNFRKGKFYCTNVCGVLLNKKGFSNQCIAQILNSVSRKYVSYVGNPKLMNNVMAVIKIIVPVSVVEQKKIANYLSNIDNKIESINKQLTQTQTLKKGLLQQMFI